MFQSMFDRLLLLFMVVILLVALTGGAFSMVSIRSTTVENRMESLLSQAREIAFLASRVEDSTLADYLNIQTSTMAYLQWKAQAVYEDYGAYILIVDRNGRIMDNMQTAVQGSNDALQTLDPSDMSDALMEVLKGKEVQARITHASRGAVFTVAVPWVQNNAVLGAVFIHTSAQIVESEYRGLLLQIAVGFALAAIVAMFGTAFYTRGIVKPLTVITGAAEDMSRGKLNTRAEVTGVNEVRPACPERSTLWRISWSRWRKPARSSSQTSVMSCARPSRASTALWRGCWTAPFPRRNTSGISKSSLTKPTA